MHTYNNQFEDCYVSLEENNLKIGNSSVERTWNIGGDIPTVVSLKNKLSNKEWLTTEETYDWLSYTNSKYAFYNSSFISGEKLHLEVEANTDDDCGIARKHFRVQVKIEYKDCIIKWIHIIYPVSLLLRSFIEVELKDNVILCEEKPIVQPPRRPHLKEISDDYQDSYPLKPIHCGWKSVTFYDVTDDIDNLVYSRHGLLHRRERNFLKGNLCFVQDHLGREGLTLIKEGPTPLAYLGETESDFFVKGMNVFTTGWGFGSKELNKFRNLTSYGSTVLLWSGDEEEGLSALNEYHNSIHVYNPEKDAFVMSNTWGDLSADGRISEEFLLKELEVAKITGVSFYQIDDGWQNGTTCNSVLSGGAGEMGYYKHNPDFWTVNKKRLPNGLEPIMASANEKGIKMGLWFSPDSINDFENWERDSNTLINLHQKYGIYAFKLDGVRYTTKAGEENVTRMLQKVVLETKGKVLFNMDVTAGVRSGYFGKLQYSSLFLENRFTGKFGDHPNYFPHCTLRNIWMLSRYYPTFRLQADFLNVKRNVELYPDDLLAPSVCGIEYSFAITMFANPLCWMEQTGLDMESVEIFNRIIPTYRKVQSDILSGHVVPVGEEPNGTTWTGFQSIKSSETGYILVIKERSIENEHSYKLSNLRGRTIKLESILGYGTQETVKADNEGRVTFQLDGHFKYALYKYTAK